MAIKLKTFPAVITGGVGVRKRLSETSVLVYAVAIQSLHSNTGYQYVGDSTVTSSNGYEFGPSDVAEIEPPVGTAGREPAQVDLKDIFVASTTDASEFRVVGWIRD